LLADACGRFEDHDLSERIRSFAEASLTAENKHLRLTLLVRCRCVACNRMKASKLRGQVDRVTQTRQRTRCVGTTVSFDTATSLPRDLGTGGEPLEDLFV